MKKLVAILLTFLLVLVGCDSVEITKVDDDLKTDAIRFSNEYEKVDKISNLLSSNDIGVNVIAGAQQMGSQGRGNGDPDFHPSFRAARLCPLPGFLQSGRWQCT